MSSGATIVIGSLVMSLVALVGGITLVLPPWRLQQLLARRAPALRPPASPPQT